MILSFLAFLVLLIWPFLWLAHGGFWRVDREPVPSSLTLWPAVTVIIPARNEESVLAETLQSLWEQDYPLSLHIVVVDDHSDDRTAQTALNTARDMKREDCLQVLSALPLPPGWTGKVWAMHQGVTYGLTPHEPARYVLFSDADIAHGQSAVRELVCRAENGGYDLVSFMVRLQNGNVAEKLMIPAFVFFFKMLYPFRWSNDPRKRLAAAAGGTMLLRRDAMPRLDHLACIRGELIDDCALARAVKQGGHSIWLGLSDTSTSTRSYGTMGEILHMIARTAYTQLGYSPLRLLGCVFGLCLTFLSPPLLLLLTHGWAAALGGLVWLMMSLLYWPLVRFYRQSPLWTPLLPLTALLYLYATVLSAWRHHRGQGGQWKGRSQAA